MTLTKVIGGYSRPVHKIIENEDGSTTEINGIEWIEQKIEPLHPIEEAEMRALWAVYENNIKEPKAPTQKQEHDLMINQNYEQIHANRQIYKNTHDAWLLTHQSLLDIHAKAVQDYLSWSKSQEK